VKTILKRTRYILFFPFLWLSAAQFFVREALFGFENACNYLKKLSNSCVIIILRLRGATVGKNCDIQSGLIFHNCTNFKNLSIGDNCHIGKDCFFDLRDRVNIGENVVISMRSILITHMDMSKSVLSKTYPATSAPITIGDNTYIGCGVTILMGCSIGACAVIAACTLVRHDVADMAKVAGVPARKICDVN